MKLGFDLPGKGDGASPQVRVASGLVTLPVWAFASDGARGSSVAVRLPPGWDVSVESGALPRTSAGSDGGTVSRPVRSPHRSTSSRSCPPSGPRRYVDKPLTVPVAGQARGSPAPGMGRRSGWANQTGSLVADALPVLRRESGCRGRPTSHWSSTSPPGGRRTPRPGSTTGPGTAWTSRTGPIPAR